MASGYPNSIDVFTVARTNTSPQQDIHPADHNDHSDAINKIQAELGLNPSGDAGTVAGRLDSLPTEASMTDLVNDEAVARQAADDALQAQITLGGQIGFVVHGTTASTARPTGFEVVFWYGSVEPDEGEEGDIWFALGAPSGGNGNGNGGSSAELQAHMLDQTAVHGITNTASLVTTTDTRLNPIITPLAKTSAYTVATGDMGKSIDVTSVSPVTITVPASLGEDGSVFEICQLGAGLIDIVGTGGVTFVSVDDLVTLDNPGSVVRLRRLSSTSWHIAGALAE